MTLINDFFEIVSKESGEGTLKCKVRLHPEHFIYQAHFPGNPVTPGVCLVQMAAEILEQEYQQSLMLSLLKNIKFKKIVHPEDEPTFVFTKVVKAEGMLSANVSIEDEEFQYVKMSLQYMCDHSNV